MFVKQGASEGVCDVALQRLSDMAKAGLPELSFAARKGATLTGIWGPV